MLVVGSRALEAWEIPLLRPAADFDAIMRPEEYETFRTQFDIVSERDTRRGKVIHAIGHKPIEIELAWSGSSGEVLLYLMTLNKDLHMEWAGNMYADPSVVYTMKMSHRYLKNSPHFYKTMDDIHHLRSMGFNSIPFDLQNWYKARTKETLNYGHPSLAQDKDSFFSDDGVNYLYDHDTIHEAVKSFEKPAFEFIKADKADVFCSKEKFMAAPTYLKLCTVLEESYVLALERHQIPNNFEPDPDRSFDIALKKVCTSIASGWWREFAWENYHQVKKLYNRSYVGWFLSALEDGKILPYPGKNPMEKVA